MPIEKNFGDQSSQCTWLRYISMLLAYTIFLRNRLLRTGFIIKTVFALTVSYILPTRLAHCILHYLVVTALQRDLHN